MANSRTSYTPTSATQRLGPLSLDVLLVLLFFFFNTFLLPEGLLYTTLLTPLFIIYLIRQRKLGPLAGLVILTIPILFYHKEAGAEMVIYYRSYLLLLSVIIFVFASSHYLSRHLDALKGYFEKISIYNFFLTVIALLIVVIPFLRDYLWSSMPISTGLPSIPRLKMFVYEPSFYALLLAPILLYFLCTHLFTNDSRGLAGIGVVGLSLLLSVSFGVIGGILTSVVILLLFNYRLLRLKRPFFTFVYSIIILAIGIFLLLEFYPYNPFFARVQHIWEGWDTSANGRTWEAFLLAWRILEETDFVFGAGLGQVKLIGHEVITQYYRYDYFMVDWVRIPNAMAETMATFGMAGLLIRFVAQIGLFFYTRVYHNYFRIMLFTFIFIYQFTGSYITNIYEYLIWIIAFLPVFPQFDREHFRRQPAKANQ